MRTELSEYMTTAQIVVSPESRYGSLVRFTGNIYFMGTAHQLSITFPIELSSIEFNVVGTGNKPRIRQESSSENSVIVITPADTERRLTIKAKVPNAASDSGYGYYPFVTSLLNFRMRIQGVDSISVVIELPPGTSPYSMLTEIRIGNKRILWGSRKDAEAPIDHYFRGDGKTIQVLLGAKSDTLKNREASICICVPYRIRSNLLPGIILMPLLVGFPIIIIWGLPVEIASFLTKIYSMLTAFPVLLALWLKNTEGSIHPLSYINAIWFFSALSWLLYAVYFTVTGAWLTISFVNSLALIPYFLWSAYNLGLLVWFRNKPTKAGVVHTPFILYEYGISLLVYLQDKLTHKDRLEPQALKVQNIIDRLLRRKVRQAVKVRRECYEAT
jgi:hypothetical protein